MEDREIVTLMKPDEVGKYLFARRVKLVGGRIVDLAHALKVRPQQASDLLYGRIPFGKRMLDRLNAIDSEFELVELIGVIRRAKRAADHGDL